MVVVGCLGIYVTRFVSKQVPIVAPAVNQIHGAFLHRRSLFIYVHCYHLKMP